ncbi:MAG: hypothetical protein ABI625_08995 [bacterium]
MAESALLSPAVLDSWSHDGALRDVPVLAVSLTHRGDEYPSVELSGLAGVIYLPSLDRDAAATLLQTAWRQRGVDVPFGSFVPARRTAAAQL